MKNEKASSFYPETSGRRHLTFIQNGHRIVETETWDDHWRDIIKQRYNVTMRPVRSSLCIKPHLFIIIPGSIVIDKEFISSLDKVHDVDANDSIFKIHFILTV